MIRFILVILTAFLYLILSIPVLLVLLLIRKKKPEVCDKVSRALIRWIFRVILFFAGTKITVEGQENIPKDRAVLYIGNHRSYFDILVTYTTVPGSCGFVAKKELARIPLLKNWMDLIHCLFLDRSDIKQGLQMILAGCEEIKSGTSICIFPEGTRGKTPSELELGEFHNGSFKMATKTGCPIIPLSISGSSEILEAHFPEDPRYPRYRNVRQADHSGRAYEGREKRDWKLYEKHSIRTIERKCLKMPDPCDIINI